MPCSPEPIRHFVVTVHYIETCLLRPTVTSAHQYYHFHAPRRLTKIGPCGLELIICSKPFATKGTFQMKRWTSSSMSHYLDLLTHSKDLPKLPNTSLDCLQVILHTTFSGGSRMAAQQDPIFKFSLNSARFG